MILVVVQRRSDSWEQSCGVLKSLLNGLPSNLFVFSDRTCTVLNVEGDAFGAGLLQNFVDRTAKKEGELESSSLKNLPETTPELSPLMTKHGLKDQSGGDGLQAHQSESIM